MDESGGSATLVAWVSAVITFLAVVVALWKEDIVKAWRKPQLRARIRMGPPDCHKIPVTMIDQTTGAVVATSDSYYFRVWVENVGSIRAEMVQVFASELKRMNASGTFEKVDAFLPMNLKWAHTHEVYADGIAPKMGRHCDLGHIMEPQGVGKLAKNRAISLELDTEVAPNTRSNVLMPGKYELSLRIGAGNAGPLDVVCRITLDSRWRADEREMLSQGVGIVIKE